jgi:putative hydrolase of the HAD superfamily
MQKQNILFNLDDTLVHCNKYFNQVIDQFAEQMSGWFQTIPKEEFKKKQLEVDMESIEEHGLTSERFPESFVNTYLHFSEQTGREKVPSEIERIRELGFKVFEIPIEPFPFMNETLRRLKKEGHELYLHTGGDESNQQRKITQLELAMYFENRIFISKHKDTTALYDIMKTMDFDPAITWMVGNSLRTDIVPALELGINTIYIPTETEWKYNVVEVNVEPKGAFLTLNSLNEVADAIHEHIAQNTDDLDNLTLTHYGTDLQSGEGSNFFR